MKKAEEIQHFLDEYGFSQSIPSSRRLKPKEETKMERKFMNVEARIAKFEKAGDKVEGFYVNVKPFGSFGNDGYEIKTDEGSVIVPSSAVLMRKMKMVEIGQYVKITFIGLIPNTKKGQNDIKDFRVEVAI